MDWTSFLSQFGGTSGGLDGVSAAPGMNMGQLGTSLAGMNVSSDFGIPQQPNYMSMLSMLGGMGGGEQKPTQPMMPAPAPQLQAGGGQFALPYQLQQLQHRPTVQALQGLLGGLYGNL